MFTSTLGRWRRGWISGACVTCLGLTGMLGGCASSRSDQQAAAPAGQPATSHATRGHVSDAIAAKISRLKHGRSATTPPATVHVPDSLHQVPGAYSPDQETELADTENGPLPGAAAIPGHEPMPAMADGSPAANGLPHTPDAAPQPTTAPASEPFEAAAEHSARQFADSDTPQTGDESSPDRRRADRLMERAHQAVRDGFAEEALRLASLAAELEKSRRADYHNGEERPSDFIAWLQSADARRMVRAKARKTEPTTDSEDHETRHSGKPEPTVADKGKTASARHHDVLRETGEMILQQPATDTDEGESEVDDEQAEVSKGGPKPYLRGKQPIALAADPAALAAAQLLASQTHALSAGPDAIDPRIAAIGFTDAPDAPADELESQAELMPEPKPTRVRTLADRDVSASEPEIFTDPESQPVPALRTTALTWFGIIGLLSGIAGMIGLKIWHVQERRYFATGPASHPAA
ncbi:MAG: hypothetical protein JSS02_32450 [Planctomycetes bacterium]|nr:hypothetical protein [Planctomycetota bacterium]